MSYRVHLQSFEGPLDLLLFLIRKNEVDIYDIPVAEITEQYLAYLEVIEMLDLDNASEYVLMAATLIRVKAKMLLPKPPVEEEEEEDPRQELVERLLEYQRYKEVAGELQEFEQEQRDYFKSQNFKFELDEEEHEWEEGEALEKQVTLYDLMVVFYDVLKRIPPVTHHVVEQIPVTIEEQAQMVLSQLEAKKQVLFIDLFKEIKERIVLIVTFIAILELVKNQKLKLQQNQPFSEIWLMEGNGSETA